MTAEDIQWITENRLLFYGNIRWTPADVTTVYDIYNRHFGELKKPTSCGACFRSVTDRVRVAYEAQLKNEE